MHLHRRHLQRPRHLLHILRTCLFFVAMVIEFAISGRPKDPVAIGEAMRKDYISCVKYRKTLVYRFGSSIADVDSYFGKEDGTFRPEIIFDAVKNRKRDEFTKVVTKDEDVDIFGNNGIWQLMTSPSRF